MDTILLFKQDLDSYSTGALKTLQQYFGLPDGNRNELLWVIAAHQAQNSSKAQFPAYSPPLSTIAAGQNHSLAILDDGTVHGWGENDQGQAPSVVTPPDGISFMQVAAGDYHSVGLLSDGTITCWGENKDGQAPSTVTPPEGTLFIQVAAGNEHSIGLLDNGQIIGWGVNYDGEAPPLLNPLTVGTRYIQITAGGSYSLGLLDDGTMVGFGDNRSGQSPLLTTPPEDTHFIQISAGLQHSLGLLDNGKVISLGDITTAPSQPFIKVAAGKYHNLGLVDDAFPRNGTIIGWGENYEGQAPPIVTPPDGTRFVQIATGDYHSLGLLDNGEIVGWGLDERGQVTGTPSFTPVPPTVYTPPEGRYFIDSSSGGLVKSARKTMEGKPILYLIAGAPGSGKSTAVQHLMDTGIVPKNVLVIDRDLITEDNTDIKTKLEEINKEYSYDPEIKEMETHIMMGKAFRDTEPLYISEMADAVKGDNDFLTFIPPFKTNMLKGMDRYNVILVFIDTEPELAYSRTQSRAKEHQWLKLHPADVYCGWDAAVQAVEKYCLKGKCYVCDNRGRQIKCMDFSSDKLPSVKEAKEMCEKEQHNIKEEYAQLFKRQAAHNVHNVGELGYLD